LAVAIPAPQPPAWKLSGKKSLTTTTGTLLFSETARPSLLSPVQSKILFSSREDQDLDTSDPLLIGDFVAVDHAMNLCPSSLTYDSFLLPTATVRCSSTPTGKCSVRRSLHLDYPTLSSSRFASISSCHDLRHINTTVMSNNLRKPSQITNNTMDMTFKQQFLSMFQPSTDNKLALKLFGKPTID
jgi:hypothetical protein